MFIEAIQSAWQTFRERLKNPIVGAFIVSWSIINWRILSILFSSLPLVQKLDMIDALETDSLVLFFWPLGSSVVYVLAMPWLLLWVEWWQNKPIKKRKTEILDLETEIAKKRLELVEHRQKVREIELNIKQVQEREKEAERLKSEYQVKLGELAERDLRMSAQESEDIRTRGDIEQEKQRIAEMLRDAKTKQAATVDKLQDATQKERDSENRKKELDRRERALSRGAAKKQ